MKRAAQALALLLMRSGHAHLVRQVQYLQVENRILRNRLPDRIVATPAERARLLQFGLPLGPAIRHLITIVHPRTFARWKREQQVGREPSENRKPGRGGRPRISTVIREIIVRMARETDWGFGRIATEVRRLHIGHVCKSTVRNVLPETGDRPAPDSVPIPWDEFIARHAKTLWACDFLTVRAWTARGRLDLYLLAFTHIHSRRVLVSPATANPDDAWMAQRARNFCIHLDEVRLPCSILIHDRDTKFTRQFDAIVKTNAGAAPLRLPPRSPNLNAYIERFVQTIKHECLNHFVVFGLRHLEFLEGEFVEHYHRERPHQGLENETLMRAEAAARDGPEQTGPVAITCESRLGGVLKHYRRAS